MRVPTVLWATLLTCSVCAQRDLDAGLGRPTFELEVETLVGSTTVLGVETLRGELFLTVRDDTNGHRVFVVDPAAGTVLRQWPQAAASTVTTWGHRDGATDGQVLAFGGAAGIEFYDKDGQSQTSFHGRPVTSPLAGDGLARLGEYRALAFDPSGDGGRGSFWTANLWSELVEIDFDGKVLTAFLPDEWVLGGLTYDRCSNTLWGAGTLDHKLIEIDPTTGKRTGRTIPMVSDTATVGGLCLSPALDGRGQGQDLLAVYQDVFDTLHGHRLNLVSGHCGVDEPQLVSMVDGGTASAQPEKHIIDGVSSTFGFDLDRPGFSGVAFINIGADAVGNARFPLPWIEMSEFVAKHVFTVPGGNAIDAPFASGAGLTLPVAALTGAIPFGRIRAQAVYLDTSIPGRPFLASNQVDWIYEPKPNSAIVVEAIGSNSFNADPTSGFWRVTSQGADPSDPSIVSVKLDVSTTSGGTMVFDTDQGGLWGFFDAGDGAGGPACDGTYRNDSDVVCGLIYDGQTTPPYTICALATGANTGWIGSTPVGVGNFAALQFRFRAGEFLNKTFEFDCDTDEGAGFRGGSMDGASVEVELSDGSRLSGALAADPNDPDRAFIVF